LIEYGFTDVRELKRIHHLEDVLLYENCNIGQLSKVNINKILPLVSDGVTFIVKTHAGPGNYLEEVQDAYPVKTIFLFRDPRGIALSAYDHGAKKRLSGTGGSFSDLITFEDSVRFVKTLYLIGKEWLSFPGTFLVKYEVLNVSTAKVLSDFIEYIGLIPDANIISRTINVNQPDMKPEAHFNVGETYRFRRIWSDTQLQYANEQLKEMITGMGYDF
jgi:hypothetical protein